jgi:glyoxylase-like metal-dependent hydrolase (beta-lactamase superfamily II)
MSFQAAIVPVTPFQQNCLLAWDDAGGDAAVVDPGGDVKAILAALEERAPGVRIGQILLTHGHIDHAGGVGALRRTLAARQGGPVPVIGPDQRDAFLLAALAEQGRAYGIMDAEAVTPDRWLVEGDTVTIGGAVFDAFHCPGHTPGHVVFVSRPLGFAIVGDVLFQNSIGRTDFPYGDTKALLSSIHDKLLPLGEDIVFVCGHGPGSTFGEEKHGNPFLQPGAV